MHDGAHVRARLHLRRPPGRGAVALANLDIFEREDLCGHVRAKEGGFREMLEGLRDLPIVGDVRGAGYFPAIELVKDRDTKESFNEEEPERLPKGSCWASSTGAA